MDAYPILQRNNDQAIWGFWIFQTVALILAFVLPEADWLVNTWLIQWLGPLIPSAAKVASVATHPHVTQAFFTLGLSASVLVGVFFVRITKPFEDYFLAHAAIQAPCGWFRLWLKAIGGIFVFPLLIYCIYVYPGEISISGSSMLRSQCFKYLMLTSRLGLGLCGGFVCVGMVAIWFSWVYAIYSFFKIPLHVFQT